ncbi:MAG: AAA family ATPase [Eubacteriales bacterium]
MKSYKTLPIGIDNFKEIIEKECYYVDKTLLIQKLLDTTSKVTLFTRPRRFGKSLNLSMLCYYFERNENSFLKYDDVEGDGKEFVEENRGTHHHREKGNLFHGLKIASVGEEYQKYQEKYPVILLNYKEAIHGKFDYSYDAICRMIAYEYRRHQKILDCNRLSKEEVEQYKMIQNHQGDYMTMVHSIHFLSECLEKAYGEKVVILIDEYDVPLQTAHFRGYYKEMIDFIRGMFSVTLKTNGSLAFAVMTGCLRISKESIFTGLNNLKVVSIENKTYGEFFGFTEEEVAEMLLYYGRESQIKQIREWYNGYSFGGIQVYNPWSLMNYMEALWEDEYAMPISYWSNTSSNSIIKELVYQADDVVKGELEALMAGGTIEKAIHEDITYEEVYQNKDNLWNFLYFTGYLTKKGERWANRKVHVDLVIPNEEVAYIYEEHIMEWMRNYLNNMDLSKLYQGTLAGDTDEMEGEITRALERTISCYDGTVPNQRETFYHGVMIGLYQGMKAYLPLSNREHGNGRPDFIVKYISHRGKACIIELKVSERAQDLEKVAQKALKQVREKEYRKGLEDEGYTDIVEYGIAFYKKSCVVRK